MILFDPMLPAALAVALFLALAAFIVVSSRRLRPGRRRWPMVRRLAIALMLLLVVLRPGTPGLGDRTTVGTGNDVFIVMDTTGSVAAEDYGDSATRLSGMKADATLIIEQFAGAKFSLVTFDTVGIVRVPLTTDATAMQSAIDVLQPEVTLYSHGSSISEAKEVLRTTLEENATAHPERQRIVFYLGDGEQTNGQEPESYEDSSTYINGGAVLGYGTEEGGRMRENTGPFSTLDDGSTAAPTAVPTPDPGAPVYIQDRSSYPYSDALSIFDERALQTIAGQLGVDYLHRVDDSPLPRSVTIVPDQPETVERQVRTILELYWVPALGAFALLLWEAGSIVMALLATRRPEIR